MFCFYVAEPGGGIATTVAAYRLVALSGNWKAVSGFKFRVSGAQSRLGIRGDSKLET